MVVYLMDSHSTKSDYNIKKNKITYYNYNNIKISFYVNVNYKKIHVCITRVLELRIFFFIFQVFFLCFYF